MNEFFPENFQDNPNPTPAEPVKNEPAAGYTFTSDGEYHGKPDSGVGNFEPTNTASSYTPPRTTYGGANSANHQPVYTNPAPPPKPPKKKKSFGVASLVAVGLAAAIIGGTGGVVGYVAADQLFGDDEVIIQSGEGQTITIDTEVDSVVQAVAQKCSPSVVGIRTTTTVSSFFGNQESSGEGSGIIYTSDGYIITNYHVIQDAAENSSMSSKVEIFLASDTDTAIPAAIVGYNISYDLAVLKIEQTGLPAIEVGDSDAVSVGEYAIAIGNPGGLTFMGSVSYGVVSGLSRTLDTTGSDTDTAQYIQTDAAINPGNSGGALVNAKGQLIGVNSVKLVASGYEGMGFAIPSNKVVEICENIITNENEPEPYLGVQISTTYDAATLQMYGYPTGAVISQVDSNSPAAKAGLQRGDIIVAFNGVDISDYTVFMTQITQCKVGETVEITIYRAGRNYTANVTLASNG